MVPAWACLACGYVGLYGPRLANSAAETTEYVVTPRVVHYALVLAFSVDRKRPSDQRTAVCRDTQRHSEDSEK